MKPYRALCIVVAFLLAIIGCGSVGSDTAATATSTAELTAMVQINSGGSAVSPFLVDQLFSGGNTYTSGNAVSTSGVANAAPAAVYQTERFGNFSYTIGGLTAGTAYTVRLHFAEVWWTGTGQRVFNVSINGAQVLPSFDIVAAAGGANKAVVRDFAANADGSGQIVVGYASVVDNAKSSAIEVLSASSSVAPTITTQPASQTVTAGQTVTFSVSATGTAPLSYQWQKSGSNISGATSASYTTPATTTADSGATFRVVVTNSLGSVTSNNATLTVNAPSGTLPSPWVDGDIGNVGLAGSASSSNGTFTVKGAGDDIWNGADAFHYVSQSLLGDGTIVARVASVQNTSSWAKAGIMIREALTTTSTFADIMITPGAGAAFQYRASTGASAAHTGGPSVTAPYWVKLVRVGGTLTGSVSSDGSTWTTVGQTSISMASSVYIGLAVTAHDTTQLNTSTFDNVTVSGGSSPTAPTITTQPASQTVTAGQTATFSVAASGTAPLSYQWQKNGSNISGATSASYTTPATTTADSGATFRVVVTNSVGSVTSNNATLTVNGGTAAVYQINCGGGAASPFAADQHATGGNPYTTTNSVSTTGVANAAPMAVYQSERFGDHSYTFPGLTPNANYTVRLHFAEVYFTTSGNRQFNVLVNGVQALTNLDIVAVAGANKALVYDVATSASGGGQITVQYVSVTNNAKSSGVEIYGAGGGTNQPPTVATAAAASPNPVTGTTSALTVLGADDGGEASLTYTWAATGTPPGSVSFPANATNAAKSTTVTFGKAGSYALAVTIRDASGATVTSTVTALVNQTLTSIAVSPSSATVAVAGTRQFTASALDQFGSPMTSQPAFTWAVTGGGTINSSGLFTAGSGNGTFTVSAASGGKTGTATVTVTTGGGRTYSTNFSLTEDPILENGNWINGGTTGIDWGNVSTTPGQTHPKSGSGGYADATALLTGTWGPNQMAQGVVWIGNPHGWPEVEIRLRSSISAHSCTGYEINFATVNGGANYIQIVRWNGPYGNFTYLADVRGYPQVNTGDVVKATIVGNVITAYMNGAQVAQATDNTYASGSPGMGFDGGDNGDYGFIGFTASDGL